MLVGWLFNLALNEVGETKVTSYIHYQLIAHIYISTARNVSRDTHLVLLRDSRIQLWGREINSYQMVIIFMS